MVFHFEKHARLDNFLAASSIAMFACTFVKSCCHIILFAAKLRTCVKQCEQLAVPGNPAKRFDNSTIIVSLIDVLSHTTLRTSMVN